MRGLAWIGAALALGFGLVRVTSWSGVRFDWTFEQTYSISEGTLAKFAALPGPVTATLYYHPDDPRIRRSRLTRLRLEIEPKGE